jgi:hypothetical protein
MEKKTFLVKVSESYSQSLEIEAFDKQEACDIVSGMEINMDATDYVTDSFSIDEVEELEVKVKKVRKFTLGCDEIIPLGTHTYNGDIIELLAFNYPSRENSYDMESGYIFKNHTKGFEYENANDEHFVRNLLTHYTAEETTDVFNHFNNEFGLITIEDVKRMSH